MQECPQCSHIFSRDGSIQLFVKSDESSAQNDVQASLRQQVQLERELAQSKLQTVQSECKIQVSKDNTPDETFDGQTRGFNLLQGFIKCNVVMSKNKQHMHF